MAPTGGLRGALNKVMFNPVSAAPMPAFKTRTLQADERPPTVPRLREDLVYRGAKVGTQQDLNKVFITCSQWS